MLRFEKAIYSSLFFKFVLPVRLSNMSIRCFTTFRIHKYSIHLYYKYSEFIMLLHIFTEVLFAPYKEYII